MPGLLALAAIALQLSAAGAPEAVELRRYPAPEANQGVAVDARHFYAVDDSRIAKYEKASGRKVAEWVGDPEKFPHLNSCEAIAGDLVCASSNYPQTPMSSSVEIFDPRRMVHLRSLPLGHQGGSLTWVDRKGGAWWAAFANYDGRGGEPGRDHRATILVRFDDAWRRTGTWTFPEAVLERFAPKSSSGGGWGPDGLLYVTGHDRRELYALRLPRTGSVLDHVATLPVPIEGQAVAWDRSRPRVLFGVSRAQREVVAFTPAGLPAGGAGPLQGR
jgi:hypothetical protein